jgi:DNA-binding MarR family transcriptional regulator
MAAKVQRADERYDVTNEALVYIYSRLPYLIQRASQILTAMFTQACRLDITLPQYQLLDLLAREGKSPQIDLARRAEIDAATTGLILANLSRSGRVERRVDSNDTRRKIVAITREGRSALAAATKSNGAIDRMIVERLGDDAPRLGRLLVRLAASATADATFSRRTNRVPGPAAVLGLALKLRRCLQTSEQRFAEVVGPLGLTMRQFSVLFLLPSVPGLTKSDLVRLLGYEASNTALVLHILHGKGLIEFVDEGRRRPYWISAAGLGVLRASHPLVVAAEQSLSRGLGSANTALFQKLLGSVLREFDGDMPQPLTTFVAVQSQRGWPVPVTAIPSFLADRRGRSRK